MMVDLSRLHYCTRCREPYEKPFGRSHGYCPSCADWLTDRVEQNKDRREAKRQIDTRSTDGPYGTMNERR